MSLQGKIIHSHSYKSHVGYEDKTVVVVGIGNSGVDVAVELSRIAKQVRSKSLQRHLLYAGLLGYTTWRLGGESRL